MKSKEFVKNYKQPFSEYCPCVIDWKGEIYLCSKGHLETLVEISGDKDILSGLPKEVSPLFYLTEKLKCVVVDYENQLYAGELSQEQRYALLDLAEAKLILVRPVDIKGKSGG